MKNEAKDMTAKRTCQSCANYHGIYTRKACTFRPDFVIVGLAGAWVCSGCYGVALDARRVAAQGKTYAFGESI